jgi:hypothetical protein
MPRNSPVMRCCLPGASSTCPTWVVLLHVYFFCSRTVVDAFVQSAGIAADVIPKRDFLEKLDMIEKSIDAFTGAPHLASLTEQFDGTIDGSTATAGLVQSFLGADYTPAKVDFLLGRGEGKGNLYNYYSSKVCMDISRLLYFSGV